jgi:hypothetical protein
MKEKRIDRISKKSDILLGIIFSLFLTFGFFILAIPDIEQKIVKIEQMYQVNNNIFLKKIKIPVQSDYVFKIKYDFRSTFGEIVFLNGNKLELRVSNKGENIITRYYYIPKDIVKIGDNFLRIAFYPHFPKNVDTRIRNYLGSTEGESIILTLKNSSLRDKDYLELIFFSILFYIFSFLLWITLNLGIKIFNLSYLQIIFNKTIGFLPIMVFYLAFGFISSIGPYAIVVSPFYLFIFSFLAVGILNVFLNLLTLFICVISSDKILYRVRFFQSIFSAIPFHLFSRFKISYKIKPPKLQLRSTLHREEFKLPDWILSWINWVKVSKFSDKCILIFIALLIFCAFFVNSRFKWFAEELAKIAYFILCVGLIIKFIKIIRTEGNFKN